MNKLCLALLIVFTSAAVSFSQIISQRASARIQFNYQSWSIENSGDISEITVPLSVYYPVNRNFSATLRGNGASATGDNMESISGFTDTQLGLNYFLENANLVFNLSFNFPSGKTELDTLQFATSALISNNIFNLNTPNFGQGLNVSAGFTWAIPAGETFVAGVGASYQYKSSFKPLDIMATDYDPGDEVLLTGGFDARLGGTATFSADAIFTLFGTDKFGNDEVFAPGNRLVLNAQFRKYFGINDFWLFARFRSRAKNEQAAILGQALVAETENSNPRQFEVMSHYRLRLNPKIFLRILAEGKFYQQTTVAFSGATLFGGGLAPEFMLSQRVSAPVILKFLKGSIKDGPSLTGFEIGAGLNFSF
jgi:hypothetical protein